jgi:c-di-GMP-binding flagellar brake protein YcgR
MFIDFFMGSLISSNENGGPMNLQKHMTTVGRKGGQTKPRSEEGIFIVERRKHPRFNIDLPLDYSIENKDHYGGVAVNASRGGLIVYLPVAIVVGTSLNIEIIFVKGFELNSIRVRAKVIWSNLAPKVIWGEYRYGLEFDKFQEGDLQKLKALLREAGEATVDKERNKSGNQSLALKRASGPQIP